MAKTAAQMVSLRSQLASSISMFRFADTSDFDGGVAYTDVGFDNAGALSPAQTPQVLGTPVPNALSAPTNLTLTTTNTATGLNRYAAGTQVYRVVFYDSQNREGQCATVNANVPLGATTGSVTFNLTNLPTGASGMYIYKNASGQFTRASMTAPGSMTDNTGQYQFFGSNYATPAPNSASTAPTPTSSHFNVTVSGVGGGFRGNGYEYVVAAYNALGSTPGTATAATAITGAPLIQSGGNGVMNAPTAAGNVNAGSLAPGTYYYRITAYTNGAVSTYSGLNGTENNSFGLGLSESLPSTSVSATLAGTGQVVLSWTADPKAVGYVIYRGSSSGGEVFLANVSGGSNVVYTDTGSVALGAMTPPSTYNGLYGPVTVQASWTGSTTGTPTGYGVWRTLVGQNVFGNSAFYYAVTSGTSFNDTGATTSSRYLPQVTNLATTANIRTVGRFFSTDNTGGTVSRFGFSFVPVTGKRYRLNVYSPSYGQIVTGEYRTLTGGLQYVESTLTTPITLQPGNQYFFYVQGEDSGSTISWTSNPRAVGNDLPQAFTTDSGTFVGSGTTVISTNTIGVPYQPSDTSPQAVADESLASLPVRIVVRRPTANALSSRGTMTGGARLPQFAMSPNRLTANPVKSIVPSWNVASPATPQNSTLLAARWVKVEVSSDAGATWATLTNQQRYVFTTPAKQLQFRYTVPQNSAALSMDRRIANFVFYPSGPPNERTYLYYNQNCVTDTNNPGYYWNSQNNQDYKFLTDGQLIVGEGSNAWQFGMLGFKEFSMDSDVTCTGWHLSATNDVFGIRFRHDSQLVSNAATGYFASLSGDGTARIQRVDSSSGLTTVATQTGATDGRYNVPHTLRLINVGSHIMFFVDGRVVLDVVENSTGNGWQTGTDVGIAGSRSVITGCQATALSNASLSNSPTWELEYVTAYLET